MKKYHKLAILLCMLVFWVMHCKVMAADEGNPEDYADLFAMLQEEVSEYYIVKDIIFFGDSRVVGMKSVGGDGYHYVGKVSAGYSWMTGNGYSKLMDLMGEYPEAAVVFCFGVNDLGNVGSYISWYENFRNNYPDRYIFFMSVNPVIEDAAAANGYFARDNGEIEAFNAQLSEAFPDRYLNCYDDLSYEGIGSSDGVHYSWNTYWEVQEFVKEEIQKILSEESLEEMNE